MSVEHQEWDPKALLIGDTLGDDLIIASLLEPDQFCEYDLQMILGVRTEVTWIIVEMMGLAPGRRDDATII